MSKKRGLRRKSITWLFPTHLRNQEHKSRGCSAKLVSISSYFTKIKSKSKLKASISPPTADAAFAVHSQSRTSPWGFCVTSRVPEISKVKAAAVLLLEGSSPLRCGSITGGILRTRVLTYQLFLLKRKGQREKKKSIMFQVLLHTVRASESQTRNTLFKSQCSSFWNDADMQP